MLFRLLPPPLPLSPQGKQDVLSVYAYGRDYHGTAGTPVDVPEGDMGVLRANGWVLVAHHGVGPTSGRPSPAFPGMTYADTDLGAVVIFDGATWRNPITGAAV